MSQANDWAKAGVMVRESLAVGSRQAIMAVTPVNGLAFQRRDTTGGQSTHTGTGGSAPQWVRLVRSGNSLKAYRSTDGASWTLVGETTQTLPSQALVGLAVTAHTNAALCTATFDNVSVQTLSSPFTASDIGSVGVAGSTSVSGGTYTVKGSGSDIYGGADSFHYYHRSLSGDGEVRARVVSMTNTDVWAKTGLMIRETTAAGSRQAYVGLTPGNGVEFLRREQTGGETLAAITSGTAPYWVRLVRVGNVFTAYASSTGTTWTQFGTATVVMGSEVRVGLAVTSHNNTVLGTGVFDSLTVVD